PPDGAFLDFAPGPASSGPVTLEILDAPAPLLRRYSSPDPEAPIDPNLAIPTYWVRPPHSLPATPGMHRYLWDMHHTPLAVAGGRGGGANYSSAAVVHNTPPTITSIWAAPGRYTVKLTANGQSYTQPLTLKLDPRVKTPALTLQQQSTLSRRLYDETLAMQNVLA